MSFQQQNFLIITSPHFFFSVLNICGLLPGSGLRLISFFWGSSQQHRHRPSDLFIWRPGMECGCEIACASAGKWPSRRCGRVLQLIGDLFGLWVFCFPFFFAKKSCKKSIQRLPFHTIGSCQYQTKNGFLRWSMCTWNPWMSFVLGVGPLKNKVFYNQNKGHQRVPGKFQEFLSWRSIAHL